MPKKADIHKVMIIGSGPIVIGQACEFDYSGTQACKALRSLGYEVVLVNSNPATIMTDPGMADVTYIEPLDMDSMTKIIEKERPDALLPNLGGQTGLNLAVALAEAGANLVSAADALGEALREISRLREGTLRRSTEDMVRLVMVIAEQVIGAEIATRPEFVLETLKQAMHHALKTDEYQVRVHPDDLAVVTDNKPLFMAAVSGLKNIRLETDPAITRGGCVVESQLGQVDATLDSRLDEIRRSLLAHLEES